MKIKAEHLCYCGHPAFDHTIGIFHSWNESVSVEKVLENKHDDCGVCGNKCKHFALPNLDYVEYLAEKKGLL